MILGVLALTMPATAFGQASRPADLADGWRTAAPDDVGLDADALGDMTASIRAGDLGNIHAVLIERRGRLGYEAYFSGPDQRWGSDLGEVEFDVDEMHDLRSVSKSITAALVGVALEDGRLESVQTPLRELLPEYEALLTDEKGAITLHHLLSMSSGLAWDESLPYSDARNDERRLTDSEDPVEFVLERELVHEPGSTWNYSGGSTQLLAVLLERATGQPLVEYAHEKLFRPLDIVDVEWLGDLAGTPAAASGLRLRPRDLARIGSLFLNQGRWNGAQVLPASWVATATIPHIENADPSSPSFVTSEAYGYQWWINTYETPLGSRDVATAVGNGGQRIILIPSLGLSVTVLSGFYNDPRHFWTPERLLLEHILPAIAPASAGPTSTRRVVYPGSRGLNSTPQSDRCGGRP